MSKRMGILFPALILMAATLPAQIGVTGGFNMNSICVKPDRDSSQKFQPDFSAGLVGLLPLGGVLTLQTELLFSRRGGKQEQSFMDDTSSVTWKTRLTYLELPVMLRLGLPGSEKAQPAVLLGGYGALRLSAKQSVTGTYTSIKDNTKEMDYGLTAGISLGLKTASRQTILLGARYVHGLSNILKNPEDGQKWRNRGFTLSAGFLF